MAVIGGQAGLPCIQRHCFPVLNPDAALPLNVADSIFMAAHCRALPAVLTWTTAGLTPFLAFSPDTRLSSRSESATGMQRQQSEHQRAHWVDLHIRRRTVSPSRTRRFGIDSRP